jgi:hypothetical protein
MSDRFWSEFWMKTKYFETNQNLGSLRRLNPTFSALFRHQIPLMHHQNRRNTEIAFFQFEQRIFSEYLVWAELWFKISLSLSQVELCKNTQPFERYSARKMAILRSFDQISAKSGRPSLAPSVRRDGR